MAESGVGGGVRANIEQLVRTDYRPVQRLHQEGVQFAGLALPWRVHRRVQSIDAGLKTCGWVAQKIWNDWSATP